MTPHLYTEDQLVEQPAIGLFAALGRQTMIGVWDVIFKYLEILNFESNKDIRLISVSKRCLQIHNYLLYVKYLPVPLGPQ